MLMHSEKHIKILLASKLWQWLETLDFAHPNTGFFLDYNNTAHTKYSLGNSVTTHWSPEKQITEPSPDTAVNGILTGIKKCTQKWRIYILLIFK